MSGVVTDSKRLLVEVAFVLNVECQLLEVPRLPVAEIGLQDHLCCLEHTAQPGLVGESDTHLQHSFCLKDVFGPVHDLPPHAGIGHGASIESMRGSLGRDIDKETEADI